MTQPQGGSAGLALPELSYDHVMNPSGSALFIFIYISQKYKERIMWLYSTLSLRLPFYITLFRNVSIFLI